ncbi:MAG: hypothetical protein MUC49_06520 [Raineya sp.]|jgi:hypothetical protein|nr:hypothetical protein [Raineya sp.]
MQNFLNQPDATFYHITNGRSWKNIQTQGLNGNPKNEIYVSRCGEFPILAGIIVSQLNTPKEAAMGDDIVILKLPQAKNNFQTNQINEDNNAEGLWTQPFQYVITCQNIPITNIELMMKFEFSGIIDMRNQFITAIIEPLDNHGQMYYNHHSINLVKY